jgi:hypothetical protein
MGALTNYVTITIQRNSVGITRAGFGTLLILTPNFVGTGAEMTRSYSDIAAVAVDYSDTSSFEYRAANAAFSQDPAPTKVKFGKLSSKPTLKYRIDVATVRNSHPYVIDVDGDGVTATTVTITSDADATNDEIVGLLETALNAVTGANYTAAVVVDAGDDYLEVTADAAGDWFSLSVGSVDDLEIAQTHADPGYAAMLTAIKLVDGDFYMVWNAFNSNASAVAIAAWCESNKRTFLLDSNESAIITTAASGATDTCADVKTAGYDNTMVMYHHDPSECAGAAWAGNCLPDEPGTETWADKQLTGVTPSPLSQTHRDNLTGKNGNGYEQVTSDIAVTFEGKVGSGEFFDTTRFLHWFEDDASKEIFGIKVANRKIPMSNPGIAKMESGLRRSLSRGSSPQRPGFFPNWKVVVPDETEISEADRASRTLNGVKAVATLQGAVHKMNVMISVLG